MKDLTNISKISEIELNIEKILLVKHIEELNLTIDELRESYWNLKHPKSSTFLKC